MDATDGPGDFMCLLWRRPCGRTRALRTAAALSRVVDPGPPIGANKQPKCFPKSLRCVRHARPRTA